MKSLRFSIQVGKNPSPARGVSCFAGRPDLRAAFAPQAARYRRRHWYGVLALLSFLLMTWLLASTALGKSWGLWGAAILGGLWLLAMALLLWRLRLRCPGCGRGVVPASGSFCPSCGNEAYGVEAPHCMLCGVEMDEGVGDDPRAYRIRGCTHCGAYLHKTGV